MSGKRGGETLLVGLDGRGRGLMSRLSATRGCSSSNVEHLVEGGDGEVRVVRSPPPVRVGARPRGPGLTSAPGANQ